MVAFKPESHKPHLHSVTLLVQFVEWKRTTSVVDSMHCVFYIKLTEIWL